MVRLCGAALGFLAFTVAILLGLWSNNPFDVILIRALWAMVGFFVLGLASGWVAWRVLDEHALRRDQELEAEFRKAQAESQKSDAQPEAEPHTTDTHQPSSDNSGRRGADNAADPAAAR